VQIKALGLNWPCNVEDGPLVSETGGKFYKEKEGKKSTNVINSHFSIKIPTVFQILE
jgi:hypothetical protein